MASDTRGSRRTLRSFCRPLAELKITWSPSRSTHTGVTWGRPSGMSVPRLAKARLLKRSRYFSGMACDIAPPGISIPRRDYRRSRDFLTMDDFPQRDRGMMGEDRKSSFTKMRFLRDFLRDFHSLLRPGYFVHCGAGSRERPRKIRPTWQPFCLFPRPITLRCTIPGYQACGRPALDCKIRT